MRKHITIKKKMTIVLMSTAVMGLIATPVMGAGV